MESELNSLCARNRNDSFSYLNIAMATNTDKGTASPSSLTEKGENIIIKSNMDSHFQ